MGLDAWEVSEGVGALKAEEVDEVRDEESSSIEGVSARVGVGNAVVCVLIVGGADDLRASLNVRGTKVGLVPGVPCGRKRGKAIPDAEVRIGIDDKEFNEGDFLGEF
jgi:hypothetical protein